MIRKLLAGFIIVAVTILPVAGSAEIYRWVDEDGNIHFGDRPGDNAAEQVKIKPSRSRSTNSDKRSGSGQAANPLPGPAENKAQRLQNQQRLLRAFEEERRIKRDQDRKQQEQADKKQKNCVRAKDDYRQYKDAGGLYELNKQGERVFLNDEQYRQALAGAQAKVEHWCETD